MKDYKRGIRRDQKSKVILRRIRQWKIYYKNLDLKYPYSLENHSALRCPDGRNCWICHPGKAGGRSPTKQELVAIEEKNDY